jgi:protein-disulfide isomerase
MTPIQHSLKNRLNWIFGLSLVGLVVSVFLTKHYYDIQSGAAGFKSFCNLGDRINCDAIALSPYATLLGGIPLSSFGAGWFLSMLLISLYSRLEEASRIGERALFWMSGFGVLTSAIYLGIMIFVLKTYCLLCFGVDLVSGLLLWASWPRNRTPAKTSEKGPWKTIALTTVVSLFVTVVLLKSFAQEGPPKDLQEQMADGIFQAAPISVNLDQNLPTLGPESAAITIVEFSDFQCPYCRKGALTLSSILTRFPGKVRVIFRNFPLNSGCNRLVPHSMHPAACDAARAAICAKKLSAFEPVYERFFEEQNSLTPERILPLAKEVLASKGIQETSEFENCMKSKETEEALIRDVEEGIRLNIQATPTFFINGRKMEGPYPLGAWESIIEKLLAS